MKKYIASMLVITVVIVTTTFSYAQSNEELKKTFTNLNKKMIEAGKAENFDVMREFYADDVISLPSYEPMLRGYNQILESHKKMKASGVKVNDMQIETTDVLSSGNLAVEIGTYKINMIMPGMGEINDFGKYLTVWKKQGNGGWKVIAETWNTDQNPMVQPGGEGPSIKSEPKPTARPSSPGGEEMKSSEAPKSAGTNVINTTGNTVILKSGQTNDQGQKPQSTTTSGDKEKK